MPGSGPQHAAPFIKNCGTEGIAIGNPVRLGDCCRDEIRVHQLFNTAAKPQRCLVAASISHSDIFAQRLSFPGMRIASTQTTVARVTTHAHAGAD